MSRRAYPTDLTDAQWAILEPLVPPPQSGGSVDLLGHDPADARPNGRMRALQIPSDAGAPKMPCWRGLDTGRYRMKAMVVTDQAAGTAGMTLVERPEPAAAINDVVVQVHASGFVHTEMAWPSTWTDRSGRDRTPSIPGHELAGVVSALGYGTTGLTVGRRVFGLTD